MSANPKFPQRAVGEASRSRQPARARRKDGTCCKQEFSGVRLEAEFKEMEECIAFNKTNTYHGTKWDENLRRWAREGM